MIEPKGVNLRGQRLDVGDLPDSLRNADLTDTDFTWFRGSLRNADFRGANVTRCKINYDQLRDAKYLWVRVDPGAELPEAFARAGARLLLPTEFFGPCFLCHSLELYGKEELSGDIRRLGCQTCGNFELEGDFRDLAFGTNTLREYRHEQLTAFIRRQNIKLLRRADLDDPARLGFSPLHQSAQEKLELVLGYFARESAELGQAVRKPTESALNGELSERELNFCLSLLTEQRLLRASPIAEELRHTTQTIEGWVITPDGWSRLSKFATRPAASKDAFVAMWFDGQLDNAWEFGFRRALANSGYLPIRLDYVEHVGFIPDEILARIRRARLMVADFTGQRGGVYFEAGFAMGLGKPVIWTVRKDEVSRVHFDLCHYNHIVWNDTDELFAKLTNRIAALFPLESQAAGDVR